MPPKFTLQTVLDVRHSRVEAIEIEMSELLFAQQQGQAMLESLHTLQTELYRQLLEQQSGEIDLFQVSQLRSNIKTTQTKIQQVLEALDILAKRVEAKRQELVAARQGEETLGILKNKEIERWRGEQAQKEGRMQDDIYISQAFRRRQEA